MELIEGGEDGVPGDSGLGSEVAGSGQPGSRNELAREDAVSDLLVQPSVSGHLSWSRGSAGVAGTGHWYL